MIPAARTTSLTCPEAFARRSVIPFPLELGNEIPYHVDSAHIRNRRGLEIDSFLVNRSLLLCQDFREILLETFCIGKTGFIVAFIVDPKNPPINPSMEVKAKPSTTSKPARLPPDLRF